MRPVPRNVDAVEWARLSRRNLSTYQQKLTSAIDQRPIEVIAAFAESCGALMEQPSSDGPRLKQRARLRRSVCHARNISPIFFGDRSAHYVSATVKVRFSDRFIGRGEHFGIVRCQIAAQT
jgi:hypothetical protein